MSIASKITKKEIGYYFIFITSAAIVMGLFPQLEEYLTGSKGIITGIVWFPLIPFYFVAMILHAVITGNVHGSDPEWLLYAIIGVQTFIFLTILWIAIRAVFRSIMRQR